MKLTRLKVCQEADQRLRHLKAVTGLRPNVLCRLGFCLSLNEPKIPNPDDYPQDSDRELNRYTLTGEWDGYYIALLRERCAYDGLNLDTDLEDYFRAHINRGVLLLFQRVKNLNDINRIVQENMRGIATTEE